MKWSPWSLAACGGCGLSLVLTSVYFESGALWWIALGVVFGSSSVALIVSFQEGTSSKNEATKELEKMALLEKQLAHLHHQIEEKETAFQQEKNRLTKKNQEALEKVSSYQRLVEMHRLEAESLKTDLEGMRATSLEKERQLAQFQYAVAPAVETEEILVPQLDLGLPPEQETVVKPKRTRKRKLT